MTKEQFEKLKSWVEEVAHVTFSEDEAILDKQGDTSFTKNIDADRYVELNWCSDEDVYLNLNTHNGDNGLELYSSNIYDAYQCVQIFSHMIHWNI